MSGEVSKKILWIFVFLILSAIAILGVLFIRGYHAGKAITSVETSATPQADQKSQLSLTITDPTADVATTSAKIAINGKTAPNASVAITGGADDYIAVADGDGNFSASVALDEGLNTVQLQAYTEDGSTTSAQRNIVYTKGTL